MKILINASNLSGGGGAQVCDSICRYLINYPQHSFIVVLSSVFDLLANTIRHYPNVTVECYNCKPGDIKAFITFRIPFLDRLVEINNIECVYTVFGPIKWRPRCTHVCGFGLSHVVMPESPFFQRMNFKERIVWWKTIKIWEYIFHRSADVFITENPFISKRLSDKFRDKKIATITNTYNQVFDNPNRWVKHQLPYFEGIQLLDIAAFGPHKNQIIALDIARKLKNEYSNFKFRFVFTIDESEFPIIPKDLKDCFYFTGKVSIEECPSLYEQCDIEFQPTLLECFTATFPEGMKMQLPIIACDLEFVHGLCEDAALYFDPLSAESAAKKIIYLSSNTSEQKRLIENGNRQLLKFDTSEQRVEKTIKLCLNS